MLRVFGCYRDAGNLPTVTQQRMESLLSINKNPLGVNLKFSSGSFSLIYEYVNRDSERYYHIDNRRDIACFIVGTIYGYDDSSFKGFSNINIAQWIIKKHAQEKSFAFVKNLRGIFNIVLWCRGVLYLVNDILGLSSMYVHRQPQGLFFCNSTEPLIGISQSNRIDHKSIVDFFVYGFIPAGKTFIDGLSNQKEGTVVRVSGQQCEETRYGALARFDFKGSSHEERIQMLHDTFLEAVAIRAPQQEVVADLTGGWDSRFILANLLKLNKKMTVITYYGDFPNLAIARFIARKFKIKHIVIRNENPNYGHVDNFMAKFLVERCAAFPKRPWARQKAGMPKVSRHALVRRFTGLFGNDLLGFNAWDIYHSYHLNYGDVAQKVFSRDFLRLAGSKERMPAGSFLDEFIPGFCFPKGNIYRYSWVMDIGRSYVNTFSKKGWERPTTLLNHFKDVPFADSRFFPMLLSLDTKKYFDYKAYTELYRKFYPEFLDIPFASCSTPVNAPGPEPLKSSVLYKEFSKDPRFISFAKSKKVVRSLTMDLPNSIQKLCLLFCWLTASKSFVDDAEHYLS